MQSRTVRIAKVIAITAIPLAVLWATSLPPVGRTGAPGETTCVSCHTGVSGSGSLVLSSTTGMTTYTPGASKRFTVSITGSGGNAGFELTARPATNLSGGVAGNFVAGAGTNVTCSVGTACSTGNPQYIRSSTATATPANWTFDWTAPTGTGNVTLYISGVIGYRGTTYSASYTLAASGGGSTAPTLAAAPASLSYSYQIGGAALAVKSIAVSASPGSASVTATSNAAWLSVTPGSGTTPVSLSASVNPAGLSAGTYNAAVSIASTGASNTPLSVPVTLTVTNSSQVLQVTPASLSFNHAIGNQAPLPYVLSVASSGSALSYKAATSGSGWLSVAPASGATPGALFVSVNPANLAAGTYNGSVTITSTTSPGGTETVPVTLVVTDGPASCVVSGSDDH